MTKITLLALAILLFPVASFANTPISGLPSATTIGGSDIAPIVQSGVTKNATMDLISQNVLNDIAPICSITSMRTVCGAFFGFVSPQWYGGFCDSTWNSNNNFHDDSTAIVAALPSGYPVYIYHCKIASIVAYQGNGEMIFSFSQQVPYDTNNYPQPLPGAIFVPNNISGTAENCAISFNGWNNVALYGINMHSNFGKGSIGTGAICTDHAFRASLAFADVNFFHAGNFGMSVGSPTVGGVPTASGGGDGSCAFFGCNVQIQFQHFVFASSWFGIRANFSDSHFNDGYINTQAVAVSSYNGFTGGAGFNSIRIEDNFDAIPTGTSSIYLIPANGEVVAGVNAIWDMTNIEFETNVHPNFDIEGGNVQYFGGHMDGTPNSALTPFDSYIYVGTSGGSFLMSGVLSTITSNAHPAYGLTNQGTTSNLSLINGYAVGGSGPAFGATASFNWLATPANLDFNYLGLDAQKIGKKSGVNIGTASPLSTLSLGGNVSIGTNFSTTAAPTGGLTVVGNVGIGTATPLSPLTVTGLGTTSPGTGGGTVCADANGDLYVKASCP